MVWWKDEEEEVAVECLEPSKEEPTLEPIWLVNHRPNLLQTLKMMISLGATGTEEESRRCSRHTGVATWRQHETSGTQVPAKNYVNHELYCRCCRIFELWKTNTLSSKPGILLSEGVWAKDSGMGALHS